MGQKRFKSRSQENITLSKEDLSQIFRLRSTSSTNRAFAFVIKRETVDDEISFADSAA